MNTISERKSAVSYWIVNKEQLKKSMQTYKKSLYDLVTHVTHPPCQFPLHVAGVVYKYLKATHVFDPFAGWGDRCLAAMSMGIDYTGVDSNLSLKQAYDKLTTTYRSESDVVMYYRPIETLFNDAHLLIKDIVFTSPPFFRRNKKYEVYHNMPEYESESEFINMCLIPLFNICRLHARYTCLYIPNHMLDIMTSLGVPFPTFEICWTSTVNRKDTNVIKMEIYCWKH